MMHKQEISKKIHLHLEKILEDFGEALLLIRKTDNELSEEMASIFLVKRRMVDLVKSCFTIYQELVKLRLLKTEDLKKKDERADVEMEFRRLFKDL